MENKIIELPYKYSNLSLLDEVDKFIDGVSKMEITNLGNGRYSIVLVIEPDFKKNEKIKIKHYHHGEK